MKMTKKLADELMNNLACVAISANGSLPVTQEEKDKISQYAINKFLEIMKEWELCMDEKWEISLDNN